MNHFNIDFERLYDTMSKRGFTLKGLACLQYPIYCIHAEILDTTPDPLSNIDRVISEFYFENPEFTTLQIAYLIGTTKVFIEQRLRILINDGLLIKTDIGIELTSLGTKVFREAVQEREFNRSYDFYIDGITFKPLSRHYYISNRNKFISEEDINHYTDFDGNEQSKKPFGPDIVHTPLDTEKVEKEVLDIERADRDSFHIPTGLKSFTNISFTKQTFPLLVAISTSSEGVFKEIVDGFPYFSESDNVAYYDAVKKYVFDFEDNLKNKIQSLEFRIYIPQYDISKCNLTTNWNEIDRRDQSPKRCYGFSAEDLLILLKNKFYLSSVNLEDVVNEDQEVIVNINRQILRSTSDKQKLIRNLIRGRDYSFERYNKDVFLFYMTFSTNDDFIIQLMRLKNLLLQNVKSDVLSIKKIIENDGYFSKNYRALLSESGEFDLLEKLDIEEFMFKF